MKNAIKVVAPRERALAIALVLSALVLAGVLFWEWTQGLQLQQQLATLRAIPATVVPDQNILPEFKLPAADAGFPELLSRNLFVGNRRLVAVAAKGDQAAMKKGQFVLVGVLISPQKRSALLRDVQTKKTETVALVGTVRGITLDVVESTRIVLRQGAETEELTLNVQAGPKLTTPPQGQLATPAQGGYGSVPRPALPPALGGAVSVPPPAAPTVSGSVGAALPPVAPPGAGAR
jgi:hypothetical protein